MSGGRLFPRFLLASVLISVWAAPGYADPQSVPIPPDAAVVPLSPVTPADPAAPDAATAAPTVIIAPPGSTVTVIPAPPSSTSAPAAPTVTITPPPASTAPIVTVTPGPPPQLRVVPSTVAVHGVDGAALQAALQSSDPLVIAGHTLDKAALTALYQPHGFQPIWTDAREQSFETALQDADSHGLDAATYTVTSTKPVARELLLTDAFLRYASALTRGRVSPKDFETDWRIDPPSFDAGQVLGAAVNGDVATVLANLAPHEAEYERLRQAMRHYSQLDKAAWHVLFAPNKIDPGDHTDIAADLRARMIAEGYLDAAAPVPDDATLYDPALSAAVSRFQTTHGLAVDGSVGKGTLAALNVSPALRARQIRWNLERWRSLPRLPDGIRIEVNVAAAQATLFLDDQPPRVMKTIVGATIHPTPVLRARMSSVLLNPPWVVPSSIITNEIQPMLKRDPNYLQKFNFAYQDIRGGKALVQKPGPTNALGQVKFEMPNSDDIYMHDTPERRLFALSRRYISHGCVRVEDPRELARILLNSDQWSRPAIDSAIATGQTQSVPLHKSLPVYVLYWTAFVDPDGTVEFRDDAYGRDRRLAEALAARAAAEHLAASDDGKGPRG